MSLLGGKADVDGVRFGPAANDPKESFGLSGFIAKRAIQQEKRGSLQPISTLSGELTALYGVSANVRYSS